MTRIVPTFWPQHLFQFNSNNDPSPGHSSLGSDGRYTCSSLPLMVFWVPYLNKGYMPEFNNGLGGDSNSGPVLAPVVYLSPTRIMAPPRATPVLCEMQNTSVQVSYLWFPGGCHICPRAAGLTSIMAQELTRIVAPFWPPGVYLSPTQIMAPRWATPILCQMKYTYLFKSPVYDSWWLQ